MGRLNSTSAIVDTYTYNGLGLRVAKTDSTGQFAQVSDGTSPASPVIADGAAVYTPGLSECRNGASLFRHDDLLGSLRFLTDSNEGVQAYRLFSAFGSTVATSGAAWEPFGWAGDAGCQTDADTGLVLMGHRLYDSRLGRFLSQDPKRSGSNWYRYAGNDPLNKIDPSGLSAINSFSAPDGRNQGPLGGNSGALMDFFANQDAWAADGNNGSSNISDKSNKSSSKKTIDQDTFNSDMAAIAMLGGGTVLKKIGGAVGVAAILQAASQAFPGHPWLDAGAGVAGVYGSAVAAGQIIGAGGELVGAGFGTALSMQAGGTYIVAGSGMMLEGGAVVTVGAGLFGLAALGGYAVGTGISNIKVDKQGNTVSDAIANKYIQLFPPPGMLISARSCPLHCIRLR